MTKKNQHEKHIDIARVDRDMITFNIVGSSPFLCNGMSGHNARGILSPPPRLKGGNKEAKLKHNPYEEFRRSMYRAKDDLSATLIEFPASAFKGAMRSAALELPAVTKTQIGRLCWVEGDMVPIYGIPELRMDMVRTADIKRTPDIRTRACVPEWATTITVSYVTPNLRATPVANLLAAAGVFIGVGDGRPEKGALSFGRFKIVETDDEQFQRIVKTGGRKAQLAAVENPTCFNLETQELLEWWDADVKRRGFKIA